MCVLEGRLLYSIQICINCNSDVNRLPAPIALIEIWLLRKYKMDSFDSLSALGDKLTEMPGHASLPQTEHYIRMRKRLAVEKAMEDNFGDEPAQIDAIAKIRCYFMGQGRAVRIVEAYMDSTTSLQDAVRQIAEPIEWAYTTANGGRLFVSQERAARYQRKFHLPEKALEMWGPQESIEEFQARITGADDAPSLEGELWDLYYTILHASKKIPWGDTGAQQKLVDLLAAIKARPNPQRPANMTIALKRYWVYFYGELWSDLAMLGAANTESWNDFPGCGAGWEAPEVNAWVNVNAFVARLTVQEVRNVGIYGSWALHDALEKEIEAEDGQNCPLPTKVYKAEALFKVAAVWIHLAGQYMYDRLVPESEGQEDPDERFWTRSQWDKWQRRFEEEAQEAQYSNDVTRTAKECAAIMATCAHLQPCQT